MLFGFVAMNSIISVPRKQLFLLLKPKELLSGGGGGWAPTQHWVTSGGHTSGPDQAEQGACHRERAAGPGVNEPQSTRVRRPDGTHRRWFVHGGPIGTSKMPWGTWGWQKEWERGVRVEPSCASQLSLGARPALWMPGFN